MSLSARSKSATSKATEERANEALSFDPNSQGPQASKSSNASVDALSTTTTALSTQRPDVAKLQSECEDFITGNRDTALRDDNLLNIVSVFSYEEILDKFQGAHPDEALSSNSLSHRIKVAKTAVASARGVDRQQSVVEAKRDQQLSGVLKRRGEVQERSFLTTRKESKKALAEDPEHDNVETGDSAPVEAESAASRNWWRTHKSTRQWAEVEDEVEGDEPSATDELARTTIALETGTPTLAQLQADCEAVLAGDADRVTGTALLSIFSVFCYGDIATKIAAAHGGVSPSNESLRARVSRAKKLLAAERGVDGKEIEREIKENRKFSGASSRRRKPVAGKGASARDGVDLGEGGDGADASGDEMDIVYSQAGPRAADARFRDRKQGLEAFRQGLRANDQLRPTREGNGEDEDEIPTDVNRHQPVQSCLSLLPARAVPPGEIEPFDLRPIGPYAGTPFFVPGFRIDGTVTPEEWMREHPGPY